MPQRHRFPKKNIPGIRTHTYSRTKGNVVVLAMQEEKQNWQDAEAGKERAERKCRRAEAST